MKKSLLVLLSVIVFTGITHAQLTGTKTIPGSYATIAAAIADLNTQGVGTGGVTFNVAAGYTETFSSLTAGLITTVTSSSTKPIVFQKSGAGANPLITAATPGTTTNADYIICIAGTDYITFDGIDVQENAANTTATQQMERGYAIYKASGTDGSQNVTIKNCNISLNKTNTGTYGIYSNNVTPAAPTTQLTVTDDAGTNSNNKFYNNSISNTYGCIYLYGYASASPYNYYDQGNDIGSVNGNTLTNFAGGSSTAYCIYVVYQNDLTIANNSITGGTGQTSSLYGIYGSTAYNANASIYNNTISLTSAGTTGYIYCLYNSGLGTTGTSNTLNIYNNTVQNCTYPTATSAYFYGIYSNASAYNMNFYGNTVTNNVIGGSGYNYLCYLTSTTGPTNVYNNTVTNNQRTGNAATNYMYCLYIGGSGMTDIHDNTVSGNAVTAISGYAAYIYGIYCSNSAVSQMVYNNTVHDQTITTSYTSGSALYGIYSYPASGGVATNAIHDNTVYNLSINNTSSGYGYIYGLYGYYMGNNYNNSVSNLTVASASGYGYGYGYYIGGSGSFDVHNNVLSGVTMPGTSGYYYGMYVTGPTTANIYNNFISDLKAPASTSTTGIKGLYISSGTNINLFYNTIYLNFTNSSTGTFIADGIYASTSPTVDMRNNIVVNTSSAPASTSYIVSAYRRSSTTLTSYASTSNNNDFYAGTPSANNLIFYDGTNSIQTLADFKTLVAPRDASSITEMPPFINSTTPPYNLHLQTTVATQCESGGTVVSSPISITDDFDNNARYPNPGYPVGTSTPSAPDIGADEFGGILLDLSPPSISFTPFLNTSSLTARTLTTTITDGTGVPTTGTGLPRLYWKKFWTGTWSSVAGTFVSGSTYTFTFGGGVVLGDSIYYYIVAQDTYSTPNIGANPSGGAGGFTLNPPACSTPPTDPYSYKIVGTLCGTFNVGTGQAYTSLTDAINDINDKELTCPVTLLLTDATYSAGETFPVILNPNPGSSATNTVTIKPAPGITPTITGSLNSGAILRILNSNTLIDGSNTVGGTTKDLTITNTATTSPSVVLIGSTGSTPITKVTLKNCTVINGANTATPVIVSDGASAGSAGNFNDITIQNNSIQQAYIGLYCIANIAPGNGSGLLVTGNDLNSSGSNSIRLCALYFQGIDGATVTNNTIGNMVNTSDASNLTGIWFATGTTNSTISGNTISGISGSSTGPRGIAISTAVSNSNIVVNGNTVNTLTTSSSTIPYGIYIFSTTTGVDVTNNMVGGLENSNTGGYGARGIYVVTNIATSSVNLYNNTVYDIKCTSDASLTYFCIGIGLEGTTGGVNIFENSVYLSGTFAGYSSATVSAALYVGTGTGLDIRDNLFVNSYDNTNGSGDKSYAVYCAGTSGIFTDINYNDYYVSGAPGILGYLSSDRTTLGAWQTATGKDANSINTDPVFTSSTNLLPTTTSMPNAGTYLSEVPEDIMGTIRSAPPDMGAYEFSIDPLVNTTTATSIAATTATLNGTINANTYTSVGSFFEYGLTTTYGTAVAGVPASVTGTSTTPISSAISGLNPGTTYHFRAKGVASPSGLVAYGPDKTFTTTPLPPAVVTTAATGITSSGATLNGTVDANNASTTVTFEYGLTTAYGSTIAGVPGTVTGNTVTPCSAPVTGLAPNTLYHYRIKGTNGGGTSNGNDMTFTTSAVPPTVVTNPATNIGTTTATLNGTVTANNASTTVTFEWGLTTSYGNVAPGIPSPVTGMTPTAVSANISGLTSNTTYHFRCVGVSTGGTTYGTDMSFLAGCPPVGPAGTITGPASVCANSTGKVYSIAPITNATGYAWTVPTGATITGGQNTTSITVSFGAASGNVSVYGTSACGNGTPSSMAVTVNPLPVPTISGPASACQGTTSNMYTTEAGMTGYTWTVSGGGTVTAGSGTNTITVTWNATGAQTVSVSYTNASGCAASAPTTYNVTVNAAPVPTITGTNSLCVNSGYYTYTTEAGFTNYAWTVSSGGTLTFGQGTNMVQVEWNQAGAQWIAVNYSNANGCQATTPTTLNVTVNGLPGAAGTITGVPSVCGGAMGVAYSVAPIANTLTYVWTLPAGATIASGAGTNAITVDFAGNASSGNITVYGNNLCGNGTSSPNFAVTVLPLPADPGTISGTTAVCQGVSGEIYTVSPIANATGYTWTVPSGAQIVAGNNTNSITVDFSVSAVSGDVTVTGSNSCGNGTTSTLAVTVNPIPPTPTVTVNGTLLTSSATSGNQWYYEGTAIPGATGQTHTAEHTGWYWVVVTLNGCASDTSNNVYILFTGIGQPLAAGFSLYPVPNDGRFNISVTSAVAGTYSIEIFNTIGLKIWSQDNFEVKGTVEKLIDLRPVPDGVYTVVLKNSDNRVVKKFMVSK